MCVPFCLGTPLPRAFLVHVVRMTDSEDKTRISCLFVSLWGRFKTSGAMVCGGWGAGDPVNSGSAYASPCHLVAWCQLSSSTGRSSAQINIINQLNINISTNNLSSNKLIEKELIAILLNLKITKFLLKTVSFVSPLRFFIQIRKIELHLKG